MAVLVSGHTFTRPSYVARIFSALAVWWESAVNGCIKVTAALVRVDRGYHGVHWPSCPAISPEVEQCVGDLRLKFQGSWFCICQIALSSCEVVILYFEFGFGLCQRRSERWRGAHAHP